MVFSLWKESPINLEEFKQSSEKYLATKSSRPNGKHIIVQQLIFVEDKVVFGNGQAGRWPYDAMC